MDRLLEFAQSVFEKTRLRILRILLERELCVCELAEVFRVSSARMSQHLQNPSPCRRGQRTEGRQVGVLLGQS